MSGRDELSTVSKFFDLISKFTDFPKKRHLLPERRATRIAPPTKLVGTNRRQFWKIGGVFRRMRTLEVPFWSVAAEISTPAHFAKIRKIVKTRLVVIFTPKIKTRSTLRRE